MTAEPSPEQPPKSDATHLRNLDFVPFPAVEQLGIVGDRRCAATIAADGTVCWLCLPRFDATPVFGALLDLTKGGYWRLGPEDRDLGTQRYLPGTAVLVTHWEAPGSVLELTDCMLWPEDTRPDGLDGRRVLLRRLRCLSGTRRVINRAVPREDFRLPACAAPLGAAGVRLQTPSMDLGLWCSAPLQLSPGHDGAGLVAELTEGEEIWSILDGAEAVGGWTVEAARAALERTVAYWQSWSAALECTGRRAERIRLSAIAVHLCTYAPTGAVIASPTAGLPERVPGSYTYDYRYCWVRDGAVAMALLVQLGALEPVGRWLDWLAGLPSARSDGTKGAPLQVLYRIDGAAETPGHQRDDIEGYRSCKPVRFGNPVYQMLELDGFGFLADLALAYAHAGGGLTEAHWDLVRRCADFVAANWQEPDGGTWELMPFQHFTSSKVMCWVALDRSLGIAALLGHPAPSAWAAARAAIHAEVMDKGWCGAARSFTQHYGSDGLDATALLIPLMGFLPPDHERVRSTVAAVVKGLSLNGLLHRFIPDHTPGRPNQPMGDREGAFLMCGFWLARTWAMLGEPARTEAVLARAEACGGTTGLFSEAGDARHAPGLLGNMPLLFSQAEYARAAMATREAD